MRELSDHNPLILSSGGVSSRGSREFRFEVSWIGHADVLPKVKEIWLAPTRDNVALDRVLFKLKKVKRFLKGWGYNLAGSMKERKLEIEKLIKELEDQEESGPLSLDLVRRRIDLSVELFQIMEEEEIHWFKRNHETWLLKGDNNTNFFHRVANGKKRKQIPFSLMDGEVQVMGTDNIIKHASDFYKSMFGPGSEGPLS
jgi:hypothetical protein